MKHKKIILLLAILILLAAALLSQRENLKPLRRGVGESSEELEQELLESEAMLKAEVTEKTDGALREPTQEEIRDYLDGTVSAEDLIDELVSGDSEYERDLSALLARIYLLQQKYVSALEQIEQRAIAEYKEKTEQEKDKKALIDWARGYIREANQLEKQCDTEMTAILEEMGVLVEEHPEDATIIDAVTETYAQQKSTKKAWYIAKMKERGLLE